MRATVASLCLLVLFVGTMGQLKVPESIELMNKAPNVTAGDAIADRGMSKEQETFPYHIEVKTIHYLLDGIENKIRSQHDKIMATHKKSQARVGEAARTKVAASQQLLDAGEKKDKANRELLRLARAKLAVAQAEEIKANMTRAKTQTEVIGLQDVLRTTKDEAAQEVLDATKSNEEQANEALEILGNEQKLVQTVRFMLAELNQKKKDPVKNPTKTEMEKQLLTNTIDVIVDKAGDKPEVHSMSSYAAANATNAAKKRFL